jgi:prepilin peptidase CpaA
MNRDLFLLLCALLLASASAVIDVQRQRIPNWLTYPGILLGLGLRTALFGWKGLISSLGGMVLAGGILLFFFLIRAMGAGDVKLLAAIGSIVGLEHAFVVLLATAIAGGILAIAVAVLRGQLASTIRNTFSVARHHLTSGLSAHPEITLDNPSAARMPYGLAIAAGTLYTFVVTWRR